MLKDKLDRYFARLAKSSSRPANFQVLVRSDRLDLDYAFATNSVHQPFHIASVGKVFTTVLLAMLEERGLLSFDDAISSHLPSSHLSGLFEFGGRDYQSEVTIGHLVGHTSGVNDYFGGKVRQEAPFMKMLLDQPDTRWTPAELIAFTRDRQTAVAPPGQRFFYSDTGYILLGLLIEAVTGKPFHVNLHDSIFRPLGMKDSYLMFYSEPDNPEAATIEEVWVNGKEISAFPSLSCDWAGGGIVSTVSELIAFHRALREGRLISVKRLQELESPRHKFRPGIHYGLGMMEIRFEGFFFLLRGLPRLKGHIGVLSTYMFYDPVHDAYIAMNMASTRHMPRGFKAVIQIVQALRAVSTATEKQRDL